MGTSRGGVTWYQCKSAALVDMTSSMPTLAHELGHTYSWPPPDNIGGTGSREEYIKNPPHGKEIWKMTIYDDFATKARYLTDTYKKYCFMGNPTIDRAWIENSHYNTLIRTLPRKADPETIYISGTIFKGSDLVEIDSLFPLKHDEVSEPSEFATEEYSIESVSSTGEILFRLPIGISPEGYTYDLPIPESENPFSVSVPCHTDMTRLFIKHHDAVIKEIVRSPNAPVVTIQDMHIENGYLTLSWSADDPDGDSLMFNIYSSKDTGNSWAQVEIFCENTTCHLPLVQLPGGNIIFRVKAIDGFNTAEDISWSVQIEDKPPKTNEISSPIAGSEFLIGEQIRFSAFVSDLEDDDIAEKSMWSSDIDGELGKGDNFESSTLSLGDHTITLSVTDSSGQTAASSVQIKVTEDQTPDVSVRNISALGRYGSPFPFVNEETEIVAEIFNVRTEAFCDVSVYVDGVRIQKLEHELCNPNDLFRCPIKWTPTEARAYTIQVELSNFDPADADIQNNYLKKTVQVISQFSLTTTGAYFIDGTYRESFASNLAYNLTTNTATG